MFAQEAENTFTLGMQKELHKIPVWKLILLATITLGVYVPYWYLKQKDGLNDLHTSYEVTPPMPIALMALSALMFTLTILSVVADLVLMQPYYAEVLDFIAKIINFGIWIGLILLSFHVRKMLKDHHIGYHKKDVKFSWLATFFFGILYLQYKINKLC